MPTTMKVLVADRYPEQGLDLLKSMGCVVVYEPDAKGEALARRLAETGADVLVVRSSEVTHAMLEGSHLRLVVRAGAGVNTIDVAAASRLGIYVSNCPGKNSAAVAELAFGLILALDRRIPDNVADLRAGRWNKKEYSRARGLLGRTLGLIGLGNIGTEMVGRARAFGMHVVAWSRSLTEERAHDLGVQRRGSPVEVAATSDVVSLHLALAPETRGLLGTEFFAALRPGAILINTARAEVVDTGALGRAIEEKGLRVGLDVFAMEPVSATGTIDDPLSSKGGVYGTHHIGASTDQAQDAISTEAARIVRTFKETGHVPNVVNLAHQTPATHLLVVRHRDRVGVLAHVLTALKTAGVNVQEMENVVFEGALAAIARIALDRGLAPPLIASIKDGNADIYDLTLVVLEPSAD